MDQNESRVHNIGQNAALGEVGKKVIHSPHKSTLLGLFLGLVLDADAGWARMEPLGIAQQCWAKPIITGIPNAG